VTEGLLFLDPVKEGGGCARGTLIKKEHDAGSKRSDAPLRVFTFPAFSGDSIHDILFPFLFLWFITISLIKKICASTMLKKNIVYI